MDNKNDDNNSDDNYHNCHDYDDGIKDDSNNLK